MNIVLSQTKTIDKVEYDRGWSWDKREKRRQKIRRRDSYNR